MYRYIRDPSRNGRLREQFIISEKKQAQLDHGEGPCGYFSDGSNEEARRLLMTALRS